MNTVGVDSNNLCCNSLNRILSCSNMRKCGSKCYSKLLKKKMALFWTKYQEKIILLFIVYIEIKIKRKK